MAKLILVRHGKSEWNHLGKWTGLTDVSITEEGIIEARNAGEAIRDIPFDVAYVSELKRAKETLAHMLDVLEAEHIPVVASGMLNERNYGIYTGKNKWEVRDEVGEELFQGIRRKWDTNIPDGESLKDVFHRVQPYYEEEIVATLDKGSNALVVAHGNSLRALVKHIEGISDEEIALFEIGVGEVHIYELDKNGKVIGKELRSANPHKGAI